MFTSGTSHGEAIHITAHRESLEALRVDPNAGPELEEKIQLIGMLEDECRVDGDGTRPV